MAFNLIIKCDTILYSMANCKVVWIVIWNTTSIHYPKTIFSSNKIFGLYMRPQNIPPICSLLKGYTLESFSSNVGWQGVLNKGYCQHNGFCDY